MVMGNSPGCNMIHRCVLALTCLALVAANAHGQEPMFDPPALNWVERLQIIVAHPTLVYLLLLFGVTGVLFEITHPGGWAPGIIGLLCLVLAFFAMRVLPINYVGVALIVLGIILVILEVKVHSAGILTTAGIVCLLLGAAFLIEPGKGVERVSWLAVAPVSIALALIMLLLIRNVVRAQQMKVQTGMNQLIGAFARVRGDLDGEGFVFIAGELWRATCAQRLQDGESVRIEGYVGLTLYVSPAIAPSAFEGR